MFAPTSPASSSLSDLQLAMIDLMVFTVTNPAPALEVDLQLAMIDVAAFATANPTPSEFDGMTISELFAEADRIMTNPIYAD
jgi:hypothetical protein